MNRNLNNVLLYALLDEVRTSEHFRTYRIPKSGEAGTTAGHGALYAVSKSVGWEGTEVTFHPTDWRSI